MAMLVGLTGPTRYRKMGATMGKESRLPPGHGCPTTVEEVDVLSTAVLASSKERAWRGIEVRNGVARHRPPVVV